MFRLLFWLLLWPVLFLGAVDYDCVFIGTSPICVLEAVAQYHAGKRVLLLDEADDLGGAWRTLNFCGVMRVDVGCHLIGNDPTIRDFLEQYVGCRMVYMDRPLERFEAGNVSPNGFYFAEGCFGLIQSLKRLLSQTSIDVLLNHRVDLVAVNSQEKWVTVSSGDQKFTASRVFVPNYCSFQGSSTNRTKFYHLYMLIQDPEAFRFTYQPNGIAKTSRVMNLTPFVGLHGSGQQLIIFQTHAEETLREGQILLDALKRKQLVSAGAYILSQEPYVYEQRPHYQLSSEQRPYFEQIETGHFNAMVDRIGRWKTLIPKL